MAVLVAFVRNKFVLFVKPEFDDALMMLLPIGNHI
jgi:hypothetical protein